MAWGWGEGEERQRTWIKESSRRMYVSGELGGILDKPGHINGKENQHRISEPGVDVSMVKT